MQIFGNFVAIACCDDSLFTNHVRAVKGFYKNCLYGLYIVYDLFYMVGITLIRTSLSVEGHKRTVGNLRHDVYILLININGSLSILGKVKKKISTKHSLTTQAYQI